MYTAQFPTLKSLQDAREFHGDINTKMYCNNISNLVGEFKERFADFNTNFEHNFYIFHKPFTVSADEAPGQFSLELIELQYDSVLKDKFSTVDIGSFYQYVGLTYPIIKCLASRMMSMFGSTLSVDNSFL
ncbi:general transcription factor II-I repeat domain-containing protein 2B-like [Oratosquilla oratoria]|uniref:general transcription factor II-I repeat domain-containing protein 2B-like n=1 Tax=Oratosquilla oratoria TaxID=337810 RepID=UPI003F76705B